jgi:acetolactate synthase-1/3 small subunit
MNIAVYGDSRTIEQITKQLHKLIDVVKVHDLTEQKHIAKELCLVRVYAPKKERTDIIKLAEHAGVRVIDIQINSLLLEVSDTETKVNQFLDLVKPFGIQDVVRSGVVAIAA